LPACPNLSLSPIQLGRTPPMDDARFVFLDDRGGVSGPVQASIFPLHRRLT
jgi:hypothetical protein